MKLKTLLFEYDDKTAKYSDELGEYLAQLRPSIKGWKFSMQRMTGTWEWNNRKFEDAIYATWGWDGQKNKIPYESSDGLDLGTGKLNIKISKDGTDEKQLKKDTMKYLNYMKKEFPKIEKKLLEY